MLALHACGSATDWALEQAARCRAAFVVSSCCVGKVNRRSSGQAGVVLQYPRSRSLQQHIGALAARHGAPPGDGFALLAATADYSHADQHSHPELAALAKANVEMDRGERMAEQGFRTALVTLLQPELTAKSDVLLGAPLDASGAAVDARFCFDAWA